MDLMKLFLQFKLFCKKFRNISKIALISFLLANDFINLFFLDLDIECKYFKNDILLLHKLCFFLFSYFFSITLLLLLLFTIFLAGIHSLKC